MGWLFLYVVEKTCLPEKRNILSGKSSFFITEVCEYEKISFPLLFADLGRLSTSIFLLLPNIFLRHLRTKWRIFRHLATVVIDCTFCTLFFCMRRYSCTCCSGKQHAIAVSSILIEEETDRREGKGRHCCLGDVLECHTSHVAARMN